MQNFRLFDFIIAKYGAEEQQALSQLDSESKSLRYA